MPAGACPVHPAYIMCWKRHGTCFRQTLLCTALQLLHRSTLPLPGLEVLPHVRLYSRP